MKAKTQAKTIEQLLKDAGNCGIVILQTETVIRAPNGRGTVDLQTTIKATGQRISWMRDQPWAVLKRRQISTQ